MSRFYGTAVNGRGNTVSFGGRGNAGQMHLRGWNAGVRVVPCIDKELDDSDVFEVYMTSGSHGHTRDILLGKVHDTKDGPVFIPRYGDPGGRHDVKTGM